MSLPLNYIHYLANYTFILKFNIKKTDISKWSQVLKVFKNDIKHYCGIICLRKGIFKDGFGLMIYAKVNLKKLK